MNKDIKDIKVVWVLRVVDPVLRIRFSSVYSEFALAQKYMLKDICETAAKRSLQVNMVVCSELTKVECEGFSWEIERCHFRTDEGETR